MARASKYTCLSESPLPNTTHSLSLKSISVLFNPTSSPALTPVEDRKSTIARSRIFLHLSLIISCSSSENVFFTDANEYIANGNYVVTWAFNYTPNVDSWRAAVVSALLQYSANGGDWADVEKAFVDGWASQYSAEHAE